MTNQPPPLDLPNELDLIANIPSEEAVLGSILIGANDTYLECSEHIQATDFYLLRHQWIYEAMTSLADDEIEIDNITVQNRLMQLGHTEDIGTAYLTYLINGVGSFMTAPAHALMVRNMSIRRGLLNLATKFAKLAYDIKTPVKQALDDVTQLTLEFVAGAIGDKDVVTQADAAKEYLSTLSDARDGILPPPITTTIPDLDLATGGLRRGGLTIVGALPSAGKSSLMGQMARRAAEEGYKVLVVTLEMHPTEYFGRFIATESGVPTNRQQQPKRLKDHEYQSIVDAIPNLDGLPIWYTSVRSIAKLGPVLHKMKKTYGLDLVIVDYIQLMQGISYGKGTSRELEVASISLYLKQYAMTYDVHIIAGSQLNKEGEARESMAIEQNADNLIYIQAPPLANGKPADAKTFEWGKEGQRVLFCKKIRGGQTGAAISVYTDPKAYKWLSFSPAQEPPTPRPKPARPSSKPRGEDENEPNF